MDEIKLISVVKEDGRTYWFTLNGEPVCGARVKNGSPHMAKPVKGSNRCHYHGGTSPSGTLRKNLQGTVNIPTSLSEKDIQHYKKLFEEYWGDVKINSVSNDEYVGG